MAAGSTKTGLVVGAVLGVPAGIVAVYYRYRGYCLSDAQRDVRHAAPGAREPHPRSRGHAP